MKTIFTVILLIMAITVQSEELMFFGGKNQYAFDFNPATHLMITKNCKNCEAQQSLSKVTKIKLQAGGADPGALICTKQLGAKVVILKNDKRDETGFCMFKDKSMISLSSLTSQSYK